MSQFFAMLACRLLGRSCSVQRPASRDLVHQLKEQTRRGEAELWEIRKFRDQRRLRDSGLDIERLNQMLFDSRPKGGDA